MSLRSHPTSSRRIRFPRFAALLLSGLAAPGAAPAEPAPAVSGSAIPDSVAPLIAEIQAKPVYKHATWGIRLADPATGETLIDQAGEKSMAPGSIMKVYSVATALDAYGPDYRFRTPVYRTGDVSNGRLSGNLILVASGDFSFGLRDQADGTLAFNSFPEIDHNYADTGFAGAAIVKGSNPLVVLDKFAEDIRKAGITEIDGDVAIDDRLFELYSEWTDGLIAPIWVNENVIDIMVTPASPGEPAEIDWRLKTGAITVEGEVETVAGEAEPIAVETVRPGVVKVTGEIAAGNPPTLVISQVPDPAAFARTAFIEALGRAGVEVQAAATGPNPTGILPDPAAYTEAMKVAEHVSPPLSEYIKVVLKVSYNRGADLLVCLAAVKAGSRDCTVGLKQELDLLARMGLDGTGTYIFDGAGSDDHGKTTPADEAQVLAKIMAEPWGAAFHHGLAILGVDGTQATNAVGTPAAGHIFIKDGARVAPTPGGHQAVLLAKTQVGYIDAKSGRQLVFAIFINNVPYAKFEDFVAADADVSKIAAAIQEAY
jgi:D-alanyl-D-alanine carboxypeptidase/D-alanyl-D-alanine-endopeptidase (penicillin-binding protein 4)